MFIRPHYVCILTFHMLRGIQVLSSISFALSVSRSVLFTNLRFVKFALIYDHSLVGGHPLPPLSPSSLVLVDSMRFELMTSSLRTRRSSNWTISPWLPRRDSNPHQSGYEPLLEPFQFTRRYKEMAGAIGFEPMHHGFKVRCLTAWLCSKQDERVAALV